MCCAFCIRNSFKQDNNFKRKRTSRSLLVASLSPVIKECLHFDVKFVLTSRQSKQKDFDRTMDPHQDPIQYRYHGNC